jgi:hypothetical protein
MKTRPFLKQLITSLSISLLLALSLFSPALAQTYNCGTYGSGAYNQNCPAAAASSGSGSSSSGFDTVEEDEKIILNDFSEYFTTDGKDLALKVGQVIYFTVEVNGVIEEHTATVKEIGADYVVLVFGPLFSELRMDVGQTVHADVTGDGKSDITIKLTGIVNDTAYLTFRHYVAEAPPIPDKQLPEQKPAEPAKSSSIWKYAGIGFSILLVLLGTLWGFVTWRGRRSNNDTIHP